jgi:transposase
MGKDACLGPGEYLPDVTEGVVCPDDLPQPLIEVITRDAERAACPKCGRLAPRLCRKSRTWHDLGDPISGRPRELSVRYAQFHCPCGVYFSTDLSDLSPKRCAYTHRVMQRAIDLVVEDNLPYRSASWHLWRVHRV